MSVVDGQRLVQKIKNEGEFRSQLLAFSKKERMDFLEQEGFILSLDDWEGGTTLALRECQLPEEAQEVQEIRNWFFVLHFLED